MNKNDFVIYEFEKYAVYDLISYEIWEKNLEIYAQKSPRANQFSS